MCGIAGVVSRTPGGDEQFALTFAMTEALRHRGPDSSGFFEDEHVALGVRRLAIIDTEHGDQPIFSEDRSVAAIANCEIYNYVELRDTLRQRGHVFRSGSDAEVIVHLYEDAGVGLVDHLRGMFAFALWDARRRRLLLARDRMGEKPLYIHEDGRGSLVFASELKALVAARAVDFEPDLDAANLFLHYGFVPEEIAAVRGVRKLAAGSWMTISAESWNIEERRYWSIESTPALHGAPAELVREQLDEISRIVIRSDVPVGIALSGGIDSSSIAALASRHVSNLQTFSVGYPGRPVNDESAEASEFARTLGIANTRIEIAPDEVSTALPSLVSMQDDPIADISAIGYAAIASAAQSAGVKVILHGQGGDELFGGYRWLLEAGRQNERKDRLLSHESRPWDYVRFAPPVRGYYRWTKSLAGLRDGWRERKRDRAAPERLVFYDIRDEFTDAMRLTPMIWQPAVERALTVSPFRDFRRRTDDEPLDVALTRLVCETYLRCNGLAQVDRLSMAYSIEPRNPLVDHRLVETVVGLRKARSDRHAPPKSWLKNAVADLVPVEIRRRKKRGFEPPSRAWRSGAIARHGERLRDGYLVASEILRPDSIPDLLPPRRDRQQFVYALLVLELWCESMAARHRYGSAIPGERLAAARASARI